MTRARVVAASCVSLAAVCCFGIVPADASDIPQIPTPSPTTALPYILYTLTYATQSARNPYPVAETVVSITGNRANASCHFQIEWIDWDGKTVGYSGAGSGTFMITLPQNGSYRFTTETWVYPVVTATPNEQLYPFFLNVYSNLDSSSLSPFEGHANIRSDCVASTKLIVSADMVAVPSQNAIPSYKSIPIIRPAGNAGD
ncbi:MAG TPA: hypothetical protein VGP48_03450 [Stellaceae bacterium]|jgi:hypothetical protein|nr:hypothetical protein [Stellaceae bacterium]